MMSKKDFLDGAEIVAKTAAAKFKEIKTDVTEIKGKINDFSGKQTIVNNALIERSDEHEVRLQTLEDNRYFVRMSRNSIDDMSYLEQERLLAWLQKLIFELKSRGFEPSANQQLFMTNIFKYLGIQDELMQIESLSMLESFGSSGTHETIYKIYLALCFLYDNSFSILKSVDDIDQMFKLNKSDKQMLREILENERIPTLGVSGLVATFDPARPVNSFKIATMISRYTKITTHGILQHNLNNQDCSTYIKSFALLAPKGGNLQEQQRNFIGSLANLLGCPESVFDVEKLFLTPQQIDVKAWQKILDSEDKKYAWIFDAAVLIALDENFEPEKNKLLEQIAKALKIQGASEIMEGTMQMLTSQATSELLDGIKLVSKHKINWKHLAEFSNFDFRGMFEPEITKLRELSESADYLSSSITDLNWKIIDDISYLDVFDDDSFLRKLGNTVAKKALEGARSGHVKELKEIWQKTKSLIDDNLDFLGLTMSYIKMFLVEIKSINVSVITLIDVEDIKINNSASNDNWDTQFDKYTKQLENALDELQSVANFNDEQLGLFNDGKINDSLMKKWQQAKEEIKLKKLLEREEKSSINLDSSAGKKRGKIIWEDISDVPFDEAEISSIANNGTEWGLISENILYYSEDGETWEEWTDFGEEVNMNNAVIKCENERWFLISKSKIYFQQEDTEGDFYWYELAYPSEYYSPNPNIFFFNNQWLLVVNDKAEYTKVKKGIIFDSTETYDYGVPRFYRCKTLGEKWEEWDNASNLPTGITLKSSIIGIGDNTILACFDYDRFYKTINDMDFISSYMYVAYVGKHKNWKKSTWPERCIISHDTKFFFIDNKWFALSNSSILSSEKGFEWDVTFDKAYSADSILKVNDMILVTRNRENSVYLSFDGKTFNELILSESGDWKNFATDGINILATYSPSEHETILRKGRIVFE